MENRKTWGIFIGFLVGYVIAKIYLIWAMLFNSIGYKMANVDGWRDAPMWDIATRYPTIFTIVLVIIFPVIGYLFVVTTSPQKLEEIETPLKQ